MKTPVYDEIQLERARMAEAKKLLLPIRTRIEKNTGKPSLSKVLARDVEREKSTLTTVDKHRRRIEHLQDDLTREQKAAKEWMRREKQRKEDYERLVVEVATTKRDQLRRDMTAMPPSTPKLDVSVLDVGAFGVLPQWPIGDFDAIERAGFEFSILRIETGNAFEFDERNLAAAGGVAIAKKRANIRVGQVLDKQRLLVRVIGKPEWPTFLLQIKDTANLVDDSLMREQSLLVADGRYKYTAVDNSERVVFVVREVMLADLPK